MPQVRVVGAAGELLGILPTAQAQQMALDSGLDLVMVAPNEKPPVCRILDYGKFKYEQKKKQQKSTKAHQIQIKEIRLRPKIGEHDVEFKLKQARLFLSEHDKVKLTVQFKGRENAHQEIGREVLAGVIKQLEEVAKVESPPRMEGRSLMAILTPKS